MARNTPPALKAAWENGGSWSALGDNVAQRWATLAHTG